MNHKQLTQSLIHKSYQEIEFVLNECADTDLIELLDCRSRKVGDSAFTILERRGRYDLVKQAVLEKRIRTILGKVRATNFFNWAGRKYSSSAEVYLAMLRDRNEEVVSNALFGLVFLQDHRNIEAIRSAREATESTAFQERFDLALEALQKGDPFLFSPGYHDRGNIWDLDKTHFAGHVGPL